MRAKRVRGTRGGKKRIFRSIEEYERLTHRPPNVEDAEDFVQAIEEEFGPQPDIREELTREGQF